MPMGSLRLEIMTTRCRTSTITRPIRYSPASDAMR